MTDDTITLTKRKQVCENNFYSVFFDNLDQDNWELPGGFIEKGESPENAARRELLEEVGMLCKSKNLHSLRVIAPFPSTIGALIQGFIAFNCYPSEHPSNPELGHKEFKWFLME